MKFSIKTKFFAVSILVALLTAAGISATYYVLIKQDKQRESRQRIRIAFDILLDDFSGRLTSYSEGFDEFLQEDTTLRGAAYYYSQDTSQIGSIQFIITYFTKVAEELKKFGHIVSADRLFLYGADKRLLAVYQRDDEDQETVGAYMVSQTGNDTYLSLDDPSKLSQLRFSETPLPETPLPSGVAAHYSEDIPDTVSIDVFSEGQQFGFRITAPVYRRESKVGVLVGEVFYTQRILARYASLSKTEINLFMGDQLNIGTFSAQARIDPEAMEQTLPCDAFLTGDAGIDIIPVTLDHQEYYQGRCAVKNAHDGVVGILSISLSQDIEKQEIQKVVISVLVISGIAIGVAFGLSLVLSYKPIKALKEIVGVVTAVAEGDLRCTVTARHQQDEIGDLTNASRVMMARLSTVVQNIRNTSSHVAGDSQAMSASATQLSQGASMQAEAAEEASSSMEEMVANIRQNADNAKQTEQIALQSAEDAREGGIAVAKTISAMKEIAEKISIIQEIAMQTHILSMNATIEAAKAQDYGKGFAVVASEVRSLSHRSGEAAEGIEKLVRSCVSISEQAGEILQRLVPNSEKTAELVQEINAASDEQHTGAAQISTAIQRLDRVIQQNAATADQMASSAEQLAEQADQLQQAIAFFTVKEVVLPETVEANTDLGQTVQAVMAMKGIDKETRATLLKTLVASNSDEIASLQEPAEQTSPDSTRPKDASHSLTDGLDDEFERY